MSDDEPRSASSPVESPLAGYRADSYGERLAARYDDWYRELDDVEAVAGFLESLLAPGCAGPARLLELAVGTGRLALPLARRHQVTGVDISAAMLARLRVADPDGLVTTVQGDMADDDALPDGPFDLVFVAYNSLFMLTDAEAQARCFAAVSRRLAPGGAFMVEAFVPDVPEVAGYELTVRSMTADQVVLAANHTDPDTQVVHGQLISLDHGQPVQLHPFVLRYCHVDELDRLAADAGLRLTARYDGVGRAPFTPASRRHVSVYRR